MKQFNFSKKRKAQVYTIITTLLLCVSACAFSNFDSSASENVLNFDFMSVYNVGSSVLEQGSEGASQFFTNSSTMYNINEFQPFSKVWDISGSINNSSTYSSYVVTGYGSKPVNDYESNFFIFQATEDSFIMCCNEYSYLCMPSTDFSGYVQGFRYDQVNNGSVNYRSTYTATVQGSKTFNGVSYQAINITDYRPHPQIISSDLPIYYQNVDYWSDVSGQDFDDMENENGFSGGVGNVSKDQWNNYEYLTGNSGIYAAITSCNSGKMQFVAQAPTGMDTDNYYIKINGECSYSITVNSVTDTRTKNILSNYTSYESSASSFTKVISASGTIGSSYDLVFEHNGIQLSALNNGVYNQPQENINSELKASSGSTMWNLANYCTDNSVALWRGVAGSMGGLSASATAGEYGSYGFSLPTMEVVNNSPMTVNSIVYSYTMTMYNENDESVGSLTKTFTINSDGSVSETEGANTLTVPNSDVEQNTTGGADYYNHSTGSNDTYNTTNNGTGSSGGSSVNGDNNIIINNNPVNNVNGGSGSGLTETDDSSFGSGFGVISKIISYIAGSKGSSVDKIDELANTDGWLSIVTSSYSFVPIQFWNLIITCFTVCLGIVIVAFIISIVIKLVT